MRYLKKIILFITIITLFNFTNIAKAEVSIIDNGLYRIKNVYSNLYLDIEDGSNANGALCIQTHSAENSSQVFKINKDTTLRYLLTVEKNMKVIEIKDGVLQQNSFSTEINQMWDIRILADDTVVFINYLNDEAIGIAEGNMNANSLVSAQKYTGTENQKWRLEHVEENTPTNPQKGNINNTNNFTSNLSPLGMVIGSIFLLLFLFVAFGQILYGFRIKPRFLVKGRLYYKPTAREEEKFINYLDFKRKSRQKIVISFDHKFKKADFYIGDGSLDYQLIIEKISEMNLPHFLEGYRSFNKNTNPIKLRVSATEPGILNFGEFIYSKHFIVDGSKFDSGDILFRYAENGK